MSHAHFQQLVDDHYASLYRFGLSLARREADASDLVQQTFYIWARHGHTLREKTRAKTWLFTTLYREFLRVHRRNERLTSLDDLPAGEDTFPAELVDHVRRLDGQQVLEVLQQIDEVFRTPLTLFYLEELSYLEIAEALDVPIGTVMSRLSRGKAQLRTALRQTPGAAAQVEPFPVSRQSPAS